MKFVTFEIGGRTYQLRFKHSAIAEMEQAAKMGLTQMFEMSASFMAARWLLWAGLRHKDGVPGITLEQAGDLLDASAEEHGGSIEALAAVIHDGLRACGILKAPEDKKDGVLVPPAERPPTIQ